MADDLWCGNCQEAPAVARREGYDVCQLCADLADVPVWLRG